MNSGIKTKRVAKLIIALSICFVLFFGIKIFREYFYGDPDAPYYIVPEEWHAFLSVTDEKTNVDLQWNLDVLKIDPGHVAMVQLFPIGTVFREVKMNEEDVLPVKRSGWFCVEIKRPGTYSVSAGVDVHTEEKENVSSVKFKKPFFINSVIHVDSDDVLEFAVDDAVGSVTGDEEGTHGAIHVGLLRDLTVTWRALRERVEQVGIPSIKPSIAWTVSDSTISANALLDVTIMGGSSEMVSMILPFGADRVDVRSGVMRDWRKTGDRLDIYFTEKVSGQFKISLSFDIPRTGDVAECSMFKVEGGRLDAGGWMLAVNDTSGLMLENNIAGLQAATDLDVPADVISLVKGKPLFFYRVLNRNAGPVFDVVTKKPFPVVDTIADRLDIFTVVHNGGEEISRLSYRIRNNNKQFLRVKMPEEFRLIYVEVDNERCSISEEDGVLLVPLVRSIQTMGGLVPFPVEIVYCRQGMTISNGDKFRLDLPELPEVPVAHVTARVFYPGEMSINSYRSSLTRVDKLSIEDAVSFRDAPLIVTNAAYDVSGWVNDAWVYNNYQVGYDAYRKNDLESAEQYFRKTQLLSPQGAPISKTTKDLLGNLMVGRGEIKGKDKLEKAKMLSIKGQLASDVDDIQTQQGKLIQVGLANLKEGDEELGAELLREAEDLGKEISRRGGSALRQKAVSRTYERQLQDIEDQRRYNRDLNKKLEKLQKQAQTVLANAPNDKGEKARSFAQGVIVAAEEENVSLTEMPVADIAWSDKSAKKNYSKRAEASQVRGRFARSGKSSWRSDIKKRSKNESLKEKNKELRKKVSILDRALSVMNSDTANKPVQIDSLSVRKSVASLKDDVADAKSRFQELASGSAGVNDYMNAEKELSMLEQKAQGGKVSFGALDDTVQQELSELEEEVKGLKNKIAGQRAAQEKQDVIEINIGKIVNTDNPNATKAFKQFMGTNYWGSQLDQSGFWIDGQNLVVTNACNIPAEFNQVVEKIADNRGNAVSVAGNTIDLDVNNVPVVNNWFSNTTATGKKYAILDEAQYRTIVQANAALSGESLDSERMEKKEVILGTPNGVNGINFTLSDADNDANGLLIEGSEINISHDQYYAVADGKKVSVLKAGELHNWQEEGSDINMEVSIPYKLDIPQAGVRVCFEKTLLSAGESPDIEIGF
ncbi:hypothetical protein ACFLS1_01205 [Verrucomicrobiota bacterium]